LCPIEWMKPVCILRCTTFYFCRGTPSITPEGFFFSPLSFLF
jgi:hypothetical protein